MELGAGRRRFLRTGPERGPGANDEERRVITRTYEVTAFHSKSEDMKGAVGLRLRIFWMAAWLSGGGGVTGDRDRLPGGGR